MDHFFLFADKRVTILQQAFGGTTFAGSQDDVRIGQVGDSVRSLEWHASGNTSRYKLEVDWKESESTQNTKCEEREYGRWAAVTVLFLTWRLGCRGIYT